MRLNILRYIILKVFVINNFINIFYFKIISLIVIIIYFKNLRYDSDLF
jgi:hypothetical protein